MRCIALAALIATCSLATAQAADALVANQKTFTPAITAAGFRAYDKAISSDFMQGRKPGTVGAQRATNYIVDQFKKLGLQPGNHDSWFQRVPTVSTTLQNKDGLKLDIAEGGGTQSFVYGADMVAYDPQDKPRVALKNSDIVFLGYGIDAPEYQWNDYANQNVKGKTVIVLVNDPGYATNDSNLFK
ncbi:MAG: aminopeptidase, partial [Rhodanobacteraceae bacterium]